MDKRREARTRKRLACTLFVKGIRQHGIVIDVSSQGIFVQTSAKPAPGESVRIEFTLPGRKQSTSIEATVARVRLVPPQLLAVAQGGIGLKLKNPPEEYFAFVGKVAHVEEAPGRKTRLG